MTRKMYLVAVVIALATGLVACSEPTKPVEKLNIQRAEDLEPIAAPAASTAEEAQAPTPAETAAAEPAELEIIEVQGFRGACDTLFVGINDENLVTVRSSTQVRTYRLAGISIPDTIQEEARNQVRIWLNRKAISVEVDESVPALDPHAYLHLCPEGTMLNEELVRAGLAVPSESPARRTDALKKASIEALTAGRGVWGRGSE